MQGKMILSISNEMESIHLVYLGKQYCPYLLRVIVLKNITFLNARNEYSPFPSPFLMEIERIHFQTGGPTFIFSFDIQTQSKKRKKLWVGPNTLQVIHAKC